jgi:hypothetical protein
VRLRCLADQVHFSSVYSALRIVSRDCLENPGKPLGEQVRASSRALVFVVAVHA